MCSALKWFEELRWNISSVPLDIWFILPLTDWGVGFPGILRVPNVTTDVPHFISVMNWSLFGFTHKKQTKTHLTTAIRIKGFPGGAQRLSTLTFSAKHSTHWVTQLIRVIVQLCTSPKTEYLHYVTVPAVCLKQGDRAQVGWYLKYDNNIENLCSAIPVKLR